MYNLMNATGFWRLCHTAFVWGMVLLYTPHVCHGASTTTSSQDSYQPLFTNSTVNESISGSNDTTSKTLQTTTLAFRQPSTVSPTTKSSVLIPGSTLVNPRLPQSQHEANLVDTVIKVPVSTDVTSLTWLIIMENRIALLCRKAIKAIILKQGSLASGERRKRLATEGDVQIQLISVNRYSPDSEVVTLRYVVSYQNDILSAGLVEQSVATLETQEVALELFFPVVVAARPLTGSVLTTSTVPSTTTPQFSDLELGLLITLSSLAGLVFLAILMWIICCCVALKNRQRRQFDIEAKNASAGQHNVTQNANLSSPAPQNETTPAIPPRRHEPHPLADHLKGDSVDDSPDDGYSEESVHSDRKSTAQPTNRLTVADTNDDMSDDYGRGGSSYHVSHDLRRYLPPTGRQPLSSRFGPSIKPDNKVAPRSGRHNAPQPGGNRPQQGRLPPLDHTRKSLVAGSESGVIIPLPPRAANSYYHRHRGGGDSSKPDSELSANSDSLDRATMHKLLDKVLSKASMSRSFKDLDKKNKKKKKQHESGKSGDESSDSKRSSSSSSSSSSHSSGSSSSSKDDKKKKKNKKVKEKCSKNKVQDAPDENAKNQGVHSVEVTHQPMLLKSATDPYAQFMASPYSTGDQVAKLENPQAILFSSDPKPQVSTWTLDATTDGSVPNLNNTDSMLITKPYSTASFHDWSKRKTINIPKPKFGTPEVERLATLKTAASDDQYTSLVLSSAMFHSNSNSWE